MAYARVVPEDPDDDGDDGEALPDVVAVPIGDELDLHTFRPEEVAELVPDYLAEAAAIGLTQVRVIHGKGTGAMRELVHAALRRSPLVEEFGPGGRGQGGWGATIVRLRRRDP
jgi:dsDNA-specific endonuclease/ATPase MutS2